MRIKSMRSLAFRIALHRSTNRPLKPPGSNWPKAFEKRHVELRARRVKAMDWKRHDDHIYDKVTEWFQVIGKVLADLSILPENVYNMDETGVMLSMLGSVKVLVGKDDIRDYRGAGVRRQMVSSIKCVSADGRSLPSLVIWPASTHRSNWTTYLTPRWHFRHSENGISLKWLMRVFDPPNQGQSMTC
ncbi:transposase [Paraphaeosphaeria sporulosa]